METMTSRPAAPLVDRLKAAGRDERLSTGALYLEAAMALAVTEAELAQSTTALSLAQTEIKGLKAERDLHYTRLAGLLFSGALDKYTGGDVQLWAAEYTKKLTEAQSRIAELENKLQRALSSLRSYDSKLADHLAALKGRA